MSNQIDLAVSSITITPDRAKIIKFSLPYALSYSRFLTNSSTPISKPFSLSSLNGQRIGVYQGTIYEDQASRIGIKDPIIKTYLGYQGALKALTDKKVDYILLDNPTALYWAANSSGGFKVIGQPYVYGFGIGIAVSNKEGNLIPALNKALLQYQNSGGYRQNYHRFLESF
jgi:polar amino acid transport system substrate-binding protein